MHQEQVWQEFLALPPVAQQEVRDFIAFLRTRYEAARSPTPDRLPALREEPFIGMWHDHSAMVDSTAWVRQVRKDEWG